VHISDGSLYTFGPVPPDVRAVAIGWLDASHPYTAGSVDDAFVADLFAACRMHATARTRGWHQCTLCQAETKQGLGGTVAARDGESVLLGDAEIRVAAADGTWLIAPTLVLHYVTDHAYQPPPEFIEAVSAGRFASS
jgi:hypothetical protein